MKMMTTAQLSDYLKAKGVRPSAQRIAILRYLMENPVHPTAEKIHESLVHDMPSLSLTTVYNTLNCLVAADCGVTMLTPDSRNAHFDFIEHPHAHTYCRSCGAIMDMELGGALSGDDCRGSFHVERVDVCYRGLCSDCYAKLN